MSAWGRDDLMTIAAVRYCLGRRTYIVGDCVDWMREHWHAWTPNMRSVIQRDVEEEFRRDDEARARGDEYKPLGMDMDRKEWERARLLWKPASSQPIVDNCEDRHA